MPKLSAVLLASAILASLSGCLATESHNVVESQQVASAGTSYAGPKSTLAVGKFDNRSSYMRGLFSDGVDRLGSQAKTILVAHLNQTVASPSSIARICRSSRRRRPSRSNRKR